MAKDQEVVSVVDHEGTNERYSSEPLLESTEGMKALSVADSNTALTTFQTKSKFKFWFLSENDEASKLPQNSHEKSIVSAVASPSSRLPNISHETNRQRHDFHQHMHEMECRLSQLTADLAQESMNFDRDIKQCRESSFLYNPKVLSTIDPTTFLNSTTQNNHLDTVKEKELEDNAPSLHTLMNHSKHWMILEQRVSSLDAQMTHAVHVQLADDKQHFYRTIEDILQSYIPTAIQSERDQIQKFEHYSVQQWESMVGVIARRYAEERATRVVSYQTFGEQVLKLTGHIGSKHASENEPLHRHAPFHDLHEQIQALFQQLTQERQQRYEYDEQLSSLLLHRMELLQEAVVETFASHDDDDTDGL
jgi:hypothetical protein